ncbi:MAG: polymer-forming cytoskeletal protein, partial [Syntrophorhabdaceae bacterium]|nr:polymer-forming cytoskeletal protein [Syntrophorhabdaceae bacterium]
MLGKKSRELETIIGNGTHITGEVSARGTIRIDGTVEGNIAADWVIVGESGNIHGNTKAKGIVVGGRIVGNIDAEESVELVGISSLEGEIITKKLSIAEGAIFDGHSR